MRNRKRLLAVPLIAVMILSLVLLTSCGSGDKFSMAEDVTKFNEKIDLDYTYDLAYKLAYDENLLSSDMGFRSAGSDAEHKAADFLVDSMKDIGLEEIEKVPVTVDKWEFSGASFEMKGLKDKVTPVSYASNGTSEEGITAEVIDGGIGGIKDLDGKDVKGKILLVSVDQWDANWINVPLDEANLRGAAAIMTYARGGYSQVSKDAINMQDICTDATIPCVSISVNQAEDIKKAIKAGNKTATLKVDNIIEKGAGTSYNVVGKIKGKSSDQQIIIGAHYDVHFNGFQDDSLAIGLIMTVADAMKKSDYKPENDIVFVAHGAEEWGASGTEYDWAIGSWKLINEAKPEWQKNTIAVLNFELPGYNDKAEETQIRAVPEYSAMVKKYVGETELTTKNEKAYEKGISEESKDTGTYDDNISYRFSGIPTITNLHNFGNGWYLDNYHTVYDNEETYDKDIIDFNIKNYGALAMYLDQTPAMEVDFNATCDDLEEAIDEGIFKKAGVDTEEYKGNVEKFREAATLHSDKIKDINERYEKAIKDGADEKELAKIRAEGKEINTKTLETFKYVQDNLIGLVTLSEPGIKHSGPIKNISIINGAIESLKKGELTNDDETGALDVMWQANGSLEYAFYNYSKEVGLKGLNKYNEGMKNNNAQWGTGKATPVAKTYEGTISLVNKKEGDKDYSKEIKIYEDAVAEQNKLVKEFVQDENTALKNLAKMIK